MIIKLKKILNTINTQLIKIQIKDNNILINKEDLIEMGNIYLS